MPGNTVIVGPADDVIEGPVREEERIVTAKLDLDEVPRCAAVDACRKQSPSASFEQRLWLKIASGCLLAHRPESLLWA